MWHGSATGITCHWCEPPLFLLACDGLCGALARASVGVGPLTADGEVAAVTQATVAAEIHQTLHVHLDFAAQVALDGVVRVDVLTDGEHFGVRSSFTRRVASMFTA